MWTVPFLADHLSLAALAETPATLSVHRRASSDQARAIQTLDNAINHLSYSHIFLNDKASGIADADAIHLLRCLKRKVFEGCEEVTPAARPLSSWMRGRLLNPSN